jgi:hypothetical protein
MAKAFAPSVLRTRKPRRLIVAGLAAALAVPLVAGAPAEATGTHCQQVNAFFGENAVPFTQTFTINISAGSWDAGDQVRIAGSGTTNLSISVDGTVVASSAVGPLMYTFPSAVPAPAPTTQFKFDVAPFATWQISCAQATISPLSGPPGTAVSLFSFGHVGGEQVVFKYKTGLAHPKGHVLCTTTAQSVGGGPASCSAAIPTANAGAPGAHTIVAKGKPSLTKAITTFALLYGDTVLLDAVQEVPPATQSSGSGTAAITFDQGSLQLCIFMSFNGLLGTSTAAHIHGPAATGATAGILFAVPIPVGVTSGVMESPECVSLTATQRDELLAGLFYVNIHSTLYPAGEIRGQIEPT